MSGGCRIWIKHCGRRFPVQTRRVNSIYVRFVGKRNSLITADLGAFSWAAAHSELKLERAERRPSRRECSLCTLHKPVPHPLWHWSWPAAAGVWGNRLVSALWFPHTDLSVRDAPRQRVEIFYDLSFHQIRPRSNGITCPVQETLKNNYFCDRFI